MTSRKSALLDQYGQPFLQRNGRPRQELVDAFAAANRPKRVEGSYDAARDLVDTTNHWANADQYDADSANNREVREKLVPRSRYEIGNNGFADGIASTYANDLVGEGPQLRMQTGSIGFNQMIELRWYEWCQAVSFRRKLWCQAHAKHSDGEGLGVTRTNPGVNNPVKLDYVLYETEQFQTPYLPFEPGYIDGIFFDEFGNPVYYDLLKEHPGSNSFATFDSETERVPARYVCHWFKLRRPGQHRGIPETSSTLNTGAASRRWRESTLTTAEMIAKYTLFLKTLFLPEEIDPSPVAMSTLEVNPGTMTALPNNVDPWQAKVEQPATSYEMFHRALIGEQARPKSMGYGIAACDSSQHNYASGQLDHLPYHKALDVDRSDGNELVLDRVFTVWFDEAIRVYGWLGGNPDAVGAAARSHLWDWPKHPTIDVEAHANSNDKKLKNGSISLHSIHTDDGRDYEDELIKQAASNGITPDQQRQVNMLLNLPQHVIPFVAQILGLAPAASQVAQTVPNTGESDDAE